MGARVLIVNTPSWEHQVTATLWALEREASLIAYDMGTGKTKIAVDVARNTMSHKSGARKVLILCPQAVATNWMREIEKWWAGPRRPRIVNAAKGTTAKAAALVQKEGELRKASEGAPTVHDRETLFVIANYDRLATKNKLRELLTHDKLTWDVLILDEVHRCKGATSATSKQVRKIKARRRVGLSGTPMPQGYEDAYGVLRAVHGAKWDAPTWTAWQHKYARPHPYIKHAKVWPKACPEIDEELAKVMVSCDADDVQDLPPQHHIWRWVELPDKVQAAYNEFEAELWTEFEGQELSADNVMVKALRLQQISTGVDVVKHEAKRAQLVAIAEELGPDEPLVVFGQFTEELARAREALEKIGRKCYMLTGAKKQTDEWRALDAGGVLLCQMQAGSVGIDLTRACNVVYLSTGYRADNYKQSLKRCHRAGQSRRVTYYHVGAQATIDEDVQGVLEGKIALEDAIRKRNEWRGK